MERLIDLCYDICKNTDYTYYEPNAFVFSSIGDFTHIDAINMSHTTCFKIRVKNRDLGVWFKHPCILQREAAHLKKLSLNRLNVNDPIFELIKFDDVFDIKYDTIEYMSLKRPALDYIGFDTIGIQNNGFRNVYSVDLINSILLTDDLEHINLKILDKEGPLRLNYQYGIFDVYCLIAPRITEDFDYFLRV